MVIPNHTYEYIWIIIYYKLSYYDPNPAYIYIWYIIYICWYGRIINNNHSIEYWYLCCYLWGRSLLCSNFGQFIYCCKIHLSKSNYRIYIVCVCVVTWYPQLHQFLEASFHFIHIHSTKRKLHAYMAPLVNNNILHSYYMNIWCYI